MIREATLADLDAISEVEAASFKKGAWPKKAIEAEFKEMFSKSNFGGYTLSLAILF